MLFTFEESELINSFKEQNPDVKSKDEFLKKFNYLHCDDDSLRNVKSSVVLKVSNLNAKAYNKFINEIPVDTFTNY